MGFRVNNLISSKSEQLGLVLQVPWLLLGSLLTASSGRGAEFAMIND